MSHHPGLVPPVSARDHAQGPTTAPITLVEYGDYECPHCGRAYPIVKQLQKEFGNQLRFVFRNFPLNEMHPNAEHAAEAAEFAATVGKFWPMHDLLFEHQTHLDDDHLLRMATQAGIDAGDLEDHLTNGLQTTRVREDFMSGVRSGVNGTPTFFINGERYNDAWDVETLGAALRATLAAR